MERFTDSVHCTSGAHCGTCRDREGGRAWRRQIAAAFGLSSVNWLCPQDKPWGYKQPSRGLGDTVAKIIKRVTRGRVKPCGGCRKRQQRLNELVPYTQGAKL